MAAQGATTCEQLLDALLKASDKLRAAIKNKDTSPLKKLNETRHAQVARTCDVLANSSNDIIRLVTRKLGESASSQNVPLATVLGVNHEAFRDGILAALGTAKVLGKEIKIDISQILKPLDAAARTLTINTQIEPDGNWYDRTVKKIKQQLQSFHNQVVNTGRIASGARVGLPDTISARWQYEPCWIGPQRSATALGQLLLVEWTCLCGLEHMSYVLLKDCITTDEPDNKRATVHFSTASNYTRYTRAELELSENALPEAASKLNLCRILNQVNQQQERSVLEFGIRIDKDGNLQATTQRPSRSTCALIEEFPTLNTVNTTLDSMQRKNVMSMLSTSVVHYGNTPWLGRFWTTDNIAFSRPLRGGHCDYSVPLVLQPDKRSAGLTQLYENTKRGPNHAAILGLGNAVTELQATSEFKVDAEGEKIDQIWKRMPNRVATLLDECIDDPQRGGTVSPALIEVIRQCLRCFWNPRFNLTREDGVKLVLRSVVWPLKYEL